MIIWLLAIGQVMNNLTNIVRVYRLWSRVCSRDLYRYGDRRKISLGLTSVRIITRDDPADLMHYLRTHDYGVTSIDGEGATGKVKMVFTIIKRQDLPQVINIIKQSNPSSFYSVEEVKSVAEGVFPFRRSRGVFSWMDSLRFYRKGK